MDNDACSHPPPPVNVKLSQCNIAVPSISNTHQKFPSLKPKVLFIGDSISANIDIRLLAHATEVQFHCVKAYSSIKDTVSNICKQAAKFPHANFTDVVPAELQKGLYHSLILQAPSVDITNLNTALNPSEFIKYFEQQTIINATNFFSVVENALQIQPTLNKVIVFS